MEIFYHSDDFGVELTQSQAIKDCHTGGVLNSISLMTTSANAVECYELIREDVNSGRIYPVVHLNFIEGPSLTPGDQLPDLTDERSFFKTSFVNILAVCFKGKAVRDRYKAQCKLEMKAQIRRFHEIVDNPDIPWGIDGHQHIHMIPLVWEALEEVVAEEGYRPGRIRRSADPAGPFLSSASVWGRVKIVNIIKWMLLKMISPPVGRIERTGADVPVFFGMFFTCRMEEDTVKRLLPKYKRRAQRCGRNLELMLHPGYLADRDKTLDPSKEDLYEMICSDFRIKEQQTLKALKALKDI